MGHWLAGKRLGREPHGSCFVLTYLITILNMKQKTHAAFKYAVFEPFSRIGRALAHPHRLAILDVLAQAPRSVEALAAEVFLSVANTSQHLKVLRGAGLVSVRQEGQRRYYALAGPDVLTLWQALLAVGEHHLAEVERVVESYLPERKLAGTVTGLELFRRLETDDVLLLDVRPEEEYRHGHIPGAWSIPVRMLPQRLTELPRDKEVVVYCRGRYCVFADEAVAMLRQHGFRARRLREGLPEWRLAGLPVAVEALAEGSHDGGSTREEA